MALEKYLGHSTPHLATSPFFGLLGEYVRGKITSSQVKENVSLSLYGETLDEDCITDIDNILASIDAASGFAEKMAIITAIRDVMDLAEFNRSNLYQTSAEIKTRLGLV
jgi:hypothetical protein